MKIAISGKMCSGKTTIADLICTSDNQYTKYSFASKIKEIAIELFNMKHKDRDLLINIGSKFREINQDVWANYVLNETKNNQYCVIDDVRFQNEVDLLIKNGWHIIQLDISDKIQEERIKMNYPDDYENHLKNRNHKSEENNLNFKPIITINTDDINISKIKKLIDLILLNN